MTRPPGYVLEVEPRTVDLQRFERLVARGARAPTAGRTRRRCCARRSRCGAAPPLAEFGYEPFAQIEVGRLEELRLAALEERIEADLALGRHAELIGELEALIAEHPHRERLRGQLMLALYRSGRQADALDAYRGRARALDELGLEPGEGAAPAGEADPHTGSQRSPLARRWSAAPWHASGPLRTTRAFSVRRSRERAEHAALAARTRRKR